MVSKESSAPYSVGIIAVAAYAHPPLVKRINGKDLYVQSARKKDFENEDAERWLSQEHAGKTVRKMRTILSIALEKGHDSVVLSAFGCGAFCKR